jgi:hypothetical protein
LQIATLEGKAMQVFPFKNYNHNLKYSKLDLPNVKPFWHMIKSLLLPGSNHDVSSNSERQSYTTHWLPLCCSPILERMATTQNLRNHTKQDYTPTECERETPMPWGIKLGLDVCKH